MTEQFEIVFFSLQPGCRLQEILPTLADLLGRRISELETKLKRSGSVLASHLSLAEAKSLQIRLVASGLLCNYRPCSASLELDLQPRSFSMTCPHCGRPNPIIENERRRRCRHCRKYWSLWAMHRQEANRPARQRASSPWLVWLAVGLLGMYGLVELSPAVVNLARAGWHKVQLALAEEVQAWGEAVALHVAQQSGSLSVLVPGQPVVDPFTQVWTAVPQPTSQAAWPTVEELLPKIDPAPQCQPTDWAWLLKLYETSTSQGRSMKPHRPALTP